jgi:rubredoxin
VEIFECPDCGFEFNAMHEVDEQVGGWECPLCEVEELQNYHTAYKNEAQGNIQGLINAVERYEEMKNEIQTILHSPLTNFDELHEAIQDILNKS